MKKTLEQAISQSAPGLREQKNIVVFSIENINNAGDEILGVITCYLLTDISGLNVRRAQMIPKKNQLAKGYLFDLLAGKVWHILSNYLSPKWSITYRLCKIGYKFRLQRYFKNELRNVDGVICSCGMLKYSTQDVSYILDIINHTATQHGIPVMISAMSVEKADSTDWRFNQLVKAVNMPCVKVITTRDGADGVERLKTYYIKRPNIEVNFVGDIALWIPEYYNIVRKDSDVIGINLIRKRIYYDYGTDFSGEQLLRLYEEIIAELEKRNEKWCLFCNGMEEDYAVGLELIGRLCLSKEKLLPRPQNAEEFVSMISRFKAVFGARLHACITAFALDIPVAGLLWDDKLDKFSTTMGIRKFFSETNELKGAAIVDKIENAIRHTNDLDNRQAYRIKTRDALHRFVQEWVNNKP